MMMVLLVKFINFDNFFSAAALFLSFINQTKYIFREIEWRRREKREEKRKKRHGFSASVRCEKVV